MIIVGFPFINKGVVVFCVSYHLGYCLLSTAALNLELMSKSTGGRVLQLIFECYKVIQKTGKRFFFLIPAHWLDCVFLEFFHQGFHYHCHLRAEHLSPCGVRALHAFAGPWTLHLTETLVRVPGKNYLWFLLIVSLSRLFLGYPRWQHQPDT